MKLIVEDRLEYRGSPYIKKGTNYDDPYFYMKSIVVTEYIGEKNINDIKMIQIQEKSLRGEGTRWNEEPINCFNDYNLYITQHKSDPATVNINEHSMTFTFDDGTTETAEAKLIDSQGDLADVDVVFDKEAVNPIIFTIKDAKKSKDLKSLLNTKVSAASLSIENGELTWCNLILFESDGYGNHY